MVDISTTAVGDTSAADELLALRIGTTNIGTVIGFTGSDCGVFSRRTSIPAATFNAAIGNGSNVLFTLTPSSTVNTQCSYSEARVVVRYRSPAACLGDLNSDRVINGADLGELLAQWGPCTACTGDLDQDGSVGGSDIAVLLGGWGQCP
jgi:hypothetical protein